MNGCSQAGTTGYVSGVSDAAVARKHHASFTDNINDFASKLKVRIHNFKLDHPRFFVFMKHAFLSLVILVASATVLLTNLYAAVTVGIAATGVISSILIMGVATNAAVGCYRGHIMQRTVNFFLQHVDPEKKKDLADWLLKFDCDNNFINILHGLITDKSDTEAGESYQKVAKAIMTINIPLEADTVKNIKPASDLYGTRFVDKLSELSDKQKKKLTDDLRSSMANACISSYKALGINLPGMNKLKFSTYSEVAQVFSQVSSLATGLVETTKNRNAVSPGISCSEWQEPVEILLACQCSKSREDY